MVQLLKHQLRTILRKPFSIGSYFFSFEAILFEADLENLEVGEIDSSGHELILIKSEKQLNEVVIKYPKIKERSDYSVFKRITTGKTALLFIIIEEKLAHFSWVAEGEVGYIYDYYFNRVDFDSEIYIGPCFTYNEFRGLGLYSLALNKICQEYKEKKKKASILTRKRNKSSYKGILKSAFEVKAIVKGMYIFIFSLWKRRNIKSIEEI